MNSQTGVEALRALLAKVCGDAEFVILKSDVVNIQEDFTCEIRTNLDKEPASLYTEKCDSWKNKFARETNCDFIVEMRKDGQRFVFRKCYVCHLSIKNKTKNTTGRVKPRNYNCEANLDIKVLNNNAQQRWRDKINGKLLTRGLNTRIKINFKHTHPVYAAEQVRLLRPSDDTKNVFKGYFENGMSANAAAVYHEMKILSELDDISEEDKGLFVASHMPRYTQLQNLYKTWRSTKPDDWTPPCILETLLAKQIEYAKQGIILTIRNDPLVVVILTPIMKRAHEKVFAGNIVFVESIKTNDQGGCWVTFMFAVCKAGGIPLAFVVHQEQNEANYTAAFKAVREAVGPEGFGGKGEPATFMTDDSAAKQGGLKAVFPTAVVLLCVYGVCQALWKCLSYEQKHGVRKEEKLELMHVLHSILYAATQESCDKAVQVLYSSHAHKTNKPFQKCFDGLYARRSDWCVYEQREFVAKRNFIKAPIRIFKDCVLRRCKAFNAIAYVDFVANALENYHLKRLLSFVNVDSSEIKPEMQYCRFLNTCSNLEVQEMSENIYKVSGTTDGVGYEVDIANATCNCPDGISGQFCKHLCVAYMKSEVHLCSVSELSIHDKADLKYIAIGSVDVPTVYQQTNGNRQVAADVYSTSNSNTSAVSGAQPDLQSIDLHTDSNTIVPSVSGNEQSSADACSDNLISESSSLKTQFKCESEDVYSNRNTMPFQLEPPDVCSENDISASPISGTQFRLAVPDVYSDLNTPLVSGIQSKLENWQSPTDLNSGSSKSSVFGTQSKLRDGQLSADLYNNTSEPSVFETQIKLENGQLSAAVYSDTREPVFGTQSKSRDEQSFAYVYSEASKASVFETQIKIENGQSSTEVNRDASESSVFGTQSKSTDGQSYSEASKALVFGTQIKLENGQSLYSDTSEPSVFGTQSKLKDEQSSIAVKEPLVSQAHSMSGGKQRIRQSQAICSSACTKVVLTQAFAELHNALIRMEKLCCENPDKQTLLSLRLLNRDFSKVRTKSQFHRFVRQSCGKGRAAPIQPTLRSRAVKRVGLTSGAKRLQRGWPFKFDTELRRTKKRSHGS